MRRFSVELLQQSPSPALRSCLSMAQVYPSLARELFNAGFVSCWTELHEQYQDQCVYSLEMALNAPSIPPEILQNLLNLAEFMEHDDKPLPIDIKAHHRLHFHHLWSCVCVCVCVSSYAVVCAMMTDVGRAGGQVRCVCEGAALQGD
jgi:phosphatidylinositol kinase/protein kinase (PI-3  family)